MEEWMDIQNKYYDDETNEQHKQQWLAVERDGCIMDPQADCDRSSNAPASRSACDYQDGWFFEYNGGKNLSSLEPILKCAAAVEFCIR